MSQESIPEADLCPDDGQPARFQLLPLVRMLRPHHWVKNLLLFVPLITGQQLANLYKVSMTIKAFALFCLTASAIYIINDLTDVENDRRHPTKCRRPIAAGQVSKGMAGWVSAILLIGTLGYSMVIMPDLIFTYVLLGYVVLTILYSFYFREILLLDVLLLAALFGYRIMAGGVAASIEISGWLLAFSGFFFLSLAFAKRFTELLFYSDVEHPVTGRGYRADDIPLIRILGPLCGYLSVLVFCIYISEVAAERYSQRYFLWLICPLLLYWITRLWFLAHRGELDDDPVVFAMRDWTSYAVAALGCLLLLLAIGWS